MKQTIFFIAAFVFLFSCKKDQDLNPTQKMLMAHTWVEDSLGFKSLDRPAIISVEPKLTLRFKAKEFYRDPGIVSTIDTVSYELSGPDKMYFWMESFGDRNDSLYYIIDTLNSHSLIITYPTTDTGVHAYFYYHAE